MFRELVIKYKKYLPIFAWVSVFISIAGALQSIIPFPLDDDTVYHAAVGHLIREHGVLLSFPWTPFTWLAEHYADKELLFHLLFVPFTGLGWVNASRIVGTICGAAILSTLYLLFKKEKVPYAGLWALIPLTGSVLFLLRFALVRPHLLSISLAVVFLWAAIRGRLIILAIIAAIYPWAYVAFWQIPCLLLITAETTRYLCREKVWYKPTAVCFTAITVGLAFHPNALNLLNVNLMEMVDLLFKHSWGKRVGFDVIGELAPYPLAGWIQGLLFNVLMMIAALFFAWRNREKDNLAFAFAFAAFGFFILTIKSARFAEYFVPLSVASMAFAVRHLKWRFTPFLIVIVTVAWMAWVQPNTFSDWSKRANYMPQHIATFLQEQIPPGSQIFNTNWDLAGWLMLTLPDRRFIVALDPTFLYKGNPDLYKLWYEICHEPFAGSAEIIRKRFGARFVLGFNLPFTRKFFYQLSSEPGVRTLLVSDTWMLFDLGNTNGTAGVNQ